MTPKSLPVVAAAGLLGLALTAIAPASAAVSEANVLSQADIVKVFPQLDGGSYEVTADAELVVPGKKCSSLVFLAAESGVAGVATNDDKPKAPVIAAHVAEFKNVAAAKDYMASHKKFVNKCAKYTDNGVRVTVKKAKAPKLGQDRLAVVQVAKGDVAMHSSAILVRQGKRVAEVMGFNNKAVEVKKVIKLGKVAAKKIKK